MPVIMSITSQAIMLQVMEINNLAPFTIQPAHQDGMQLHVAHVTLKDVMGVLLGFGVKMSKNIHVLNVPPIKLCCQSALLHQTQSAKNVVNCLAIIIL